MDPFFILDWRLIAMTLSAYVLKHSHVDIFVEQDTCRGVDRFIMSKIRLDKTDILIHILCTVHIQETNGYKILNP